VEIVDPYWLFAAHAGDAPMSGEAPVCALPPGDPWMDTILRPLIESLGYRVVAAADGVVADIVIASAEVDRDAPACAGEIVRIRARPELGGVNDDSIYRYDRAALINALARHVKESAHG